MRTASVTIAGRDYPVCFSTDCALACEEKYGGLPELLELFDAPQLSDKLRALTWLAARMLDAGAEYARLLGETPESPPDEAALRRALGMGDVVPLERALIGVILADMHRDVEVEPPKNA